MDDKITSTLSAIFNEAIELNKIKNTNTEEQIDYGALFFKPPNKSTFNSTGESPSIYSDRSPLISPETMNPTVSSLFKQYANSVNNNNHNNNVNSQASNSNQVNNLSNVTNNLTNLNNLSINNQPPISQLACNLFEQSSTTQQQRICTSTPIKTLCTNAHNADSNKDASLIATARNLSNYLSPANCLVTTDNNYRTFNYPATGNSSLLPASNTNMSYEQNISNLTGNSSGLMNYSNINHRLNADKNRLMMNSCMSNELSPSDYPFGTGWQDENQMSFLYNSFTGVYLEQIYRQAKMHRQAAQFNVARCTWRGHLPTKKTHKNPVYSPKVFLGGIAWDCTEQTLKTHFARFGRIEVVWPRETKNSNGNSPFRCGYVYIVFENQDKVKALLQECAYDNRNGGKYYYYIPTKRMPNKEVQVIPWIIADSNYVRNPSQRLDPKKTVFAGALHGLITAETLAIIMDDLFGNVAYVGIDTDEKNYPSGSARLCFSSTQSYIRAILAGFVEVKSNKFNKKIQLDPYLEPSNCSNRCIQPGTVFCRSLKCFRYFCVDCYYWYHSHHNYHNHYPMMRIKREKN